MRLLYLIAVLCPLLLACGDDETKRSRGAVEQDACESLDCGMGRCELDEDAARCVCDKGYEGEDCRSCSVGWSRQGDGCVATCASAGLDCGAHGRCDDDGGTPRCICDAGYDGERCADCAKGFHYPDEDGTCTLACGGDGLVCKHGSCDDSGGPAVCSCDQGWTGKRCDSCEDGMQDHDGDGVCKPDCATAALSCPNNGPRYGCVDTSGEAICDCSSGFVLDGSRCILAAGPADPHFLEPDVWSVSGDVILDPTNGGWAKFPPTAGCDFASVSQTFDFGSYEELGPIALEVNGSVEDWARGGLSIRANGHDHFIEPFNGTTRQICFGENAYGPRLTLEVGAVSGRSYCDTSIQSLDFVRAIPRNTDSCPALGEVRDGGFTSGWLGVKSGGGSASISEGRGRLFYAGAKACDTAELRGRISIPSAQSMPGSALEFDLLGTGLLDVKLAGLTIGTVASNSDPTSNDWKKARVCLPEWLAGTGQNLTLSLAQPILDCGTALPYRELLVDDLEVVPEPACAAPVLTNGSFEGPPELHSLKYSPMDSFASSARYDDSEGAARTGSRALRFDWIDGSFFVEFHFRLPEGIRRPGLRAWIRGEPGGKMSVTSSRSRIFAKETWTQVGLCLPDTAPGIRTAYLNVEGAAGAPPQSLWLDDVEVIGDTTCP